MRDDRGLIQLQSEVPKVSVPDHWAERKASSQRPRLSAYVADKTLLLVAVGPTLPEAGDGPTPKALSISCPDLSEAYRIAREQPVDVLAVPPDVPRDKLRGLRQRFPPTYGVLVRPLHDEPALIATAAALHADGYMSDSDDVGLTLRALVEGLCPMPPFMRRWLLDRHMAVAQRGSPFSGREEQVLRYLVAGVPNKAIAAQLGLSEASAKEYVKRILWKMGASNRTEAAVRALREGLVP
jgi:DNA-binding NarL/FixJ family response regulator